MLSMQRNLTRTFYGILSLPSTAMGFALSIQISALSWLLTTRYHLDIHEVGIVWAAGPLAGIFGQVIIGLISDKVWFWGGRRRPFILIGGLLASSMLLALPNIDAIRSFFGIESLLGVAIVVALTLDLAINISFNPTRSIIADVTPEGNPRTKGYTWMQTVSGFFGVLAYIVGAVFGNYVLIYLGVGVVLLFSIGPLFLITEQKDTPSEHKPGVDSAAADVSEKTQWSQLIRLFVAHAFSWIGVQTMFVYIIAYVQQKLVSPTEGAAAISGQVIAVSFAVLNTVGFLLPGFVLEPIAERMGRVRTHASAVAVMAAGYFLIVLFGRTPFALYGLMIILGVGWGAIVSLPFAVMSEFVAKSRMGLFMGIFNLSVVLPQLFVSLGLGGIIQRAEDKNIIFIISAVSVALSALLWTLVREKKTALKIDSSSHGAH
ncbi:MAG TPA: MFS transporter [Bacteroidota bacterium]|nr:MFS transporter [Bacteroidota bacterium]